MRAYLLTLSLCLLFLPIAYAQKAETKSFKFSKWESMDLTLSYFNVLPKKNGSIELWFDAKTGKHDGIVGLKGPKLTQLNRKKPTHFNATIVKNYKAHLPDRPSPIISRTSATRLKSGGYLILSQIGPAYKGGASELYPALFYSPTGKNGSFVHLGPPAGEPADWLKKQRTKKKRIRAEGVAIIEMSDGSLRMYVQGYGVKMALLTAPSHKGPWTFSKNKDGSIRDLLKDSQGGWLFPTVIKIGKHGYMMTGANKWPPTEIHVAYSKKGEHFSVVSQADKNLPIIKPSDILPEAKSMKALRGAYDEKTGNFDVVVNIWNGKKKTYALYTSSCQFPLGVFKEIKD